MRNYKEMVLALYQLSAIIGDVAYYIPADVFCLSYEPKTLNEAIKKLGDFNSFWDKKGVYCEYSVKQMESGDVSIVITNEKIKMFRKLPEINMFEG